MKLFLFSVYDDKAKAYISPFVLPNSAMAARAFADCVNDSDHAFGRNPADYTLFLIGSFDPSSGVLDRAEPMQPVGNGVQFKMTIATPDSVSTDN